METTTKRGRPQENLKNEDGHKNDLKKEDNKAGLQKLI